MINAHQHNKITGRNCLCHSWRGTHSDECMGNPLPISASRVPVLGHSNLQRSGTRGCHCSWRYQHSPTAPISGGSRVGLSPVTYTLGCKQAAQQHYSIPAPHHTDKGPSVSLISSAETKLRDWVCLYALKVNSGLWRVTLTMQLEIAYLKEKLRSRSGFRWCSDFPVLVSSLLASQYKGVSWACSHPELPAITYSKVLAALGCTQRGIQWSVEGYQIILILPVISWVILRAL